MKDHRLVQSALFLVFVAATLIYAVFVEIKHEVVRDDLIKIAQHYGLTSVPVPIVSTGITTALSGDQFTQEVGGEQPTTKSDTGVLVDSEDSFLQDVLLANGSGKMLSWASLYYGSLDVLKTLGIRYEYILKDSIYDIFYVYIGKNPSYELKPLIESIWWKTVEIYAKNDIVNNLYFWDRVTFMELPQTPKTITQLFVRMGSDLWMIQDVSGEYKKHKRHIRTVFTGQ